MKKKQNTKRSVLPGKDNAQTTRSCDIWKFLENGLGLFAKTAMDDREREEIEGIRRLLGLTDGIAKRGTGKRSRGPYAILGQSRGDAAAGAERDAAGYIRNTARPNPWDLASFRAHAVEGVALSLMEGRPVNVPFLGVVSVRTGENFRRVIERERQHAGPWSGVGLEQLAAER